MASPRAARVGLVWKLGEEVLDILANLLFDLCVKVPFAALARCSFSMIVYTICAHNQCHVVLTRRIE